VIAKNWSEPSCIPELALPSTCREIKIVAKQPRAKRAVRFFCPCNLKPAIEKIDHFGFVLPKS